ncbi:hypothetical protein [Paeniglutamicibacter kerguelensis]|uniref:Uncharacterized protein n=1 Tax=Paeniglutamicibacter kerguelensis TaxID=254788 RepID=A0ABS4XE14_9MICC|nr:hypothetical protein [Paeniglutamicibacter kerguelensis]MBP2386628.1 hypothetical protein [Paeniglutamicibacter kerguelensis]
MSVVVALATGEKYRNDDEEGSQVAYKILDNGALAVVVKPVGGELAILREFSPAGYAWVEGKRFLGDVERLAGTDGIVVFG